MSRYDDMPTAEGSNEAQITELHLEPMERKRGKWEFSRRDENIYDIRGNESWANWYRCSNCRFTHEFIENHIGQYNYCPQCGAYMRGDTDEQIH